MSEVAQAEAQRAVVEEAKKVAEAAGVPVSPEVGRLESTVQFFEDYFGTIPHFKAVQTWRMFKNQYLMMDTSHEAYEAYVGKVSDEKQLHTDRSEEAAKVALEIEAILADRYIAVSYTHLTLPTKRIV